VDAIVGDETLSVSQHVLTATLETAVRWQFVIG
jgi:hypothetical protein